MGEDYYICGKLLHLWEGVTTLVGVMEYTLSLHNSNSTFAEIECMDRWEKGLSPILGDFELKNGSYLLYGNLISMKDLPGSS